MNNVLITGGCGFIGSNLILYLLNKHADMQIVNFDKLTYAADMNHLRSVSRHHNYWFVQGDICDEQLVGDTIQEYEIDSIIHLAAESHVDNSINNPSQFVTTNVNGTCVLLEAFRKYCDGRFHYVSTDEIYGALGHEGFFHEDSPLRPNSPYSASKAAAGLMARSYHKTFGLDVVTTSCSNNYGRHQHREKLIPTVISTAKNGHNIPVYGHGNNVRDWLHVDDHCSAIDLVFRDGAPGEMYNIGGDNEICNIDLVKQICRVLDQMHPKEHPHESQIQFVEDRKGHDFRYAVDSTKIKTELNWCPSSDFDLLLEQTIKYYV
jgi:dTDP-glucose 4,6-dehydratase